MKKSEPLQNVLTVVLVLCAVVVTGLLVRRELSPAAQSTPRVSSGVVQDWRSYADAGHRAGSAGAVVTIVEFSDFQCPYCRLMAARLDSLRAEFPDSVEVVYRHFPLRIHEHAVDAAQASECAAEQGGFWAMHDALFQEQDSIGRVSWARYAGAAGIADSGAFAECMDRRAEDVGSIRADTAAGRRLGVTATPTLLINEYHIIGSPPLDSLRAYVRRAAETRRRPES